MAEVAGTAAGLVSLGLQLYGSITTYLDAIETRKDEIALATRLSTSMSESLEIINSATQNCGTSHPAANKAIVDSMQSCNIELQRLRQVISELAPDLSPTNFVEKAREGLRKLRYPFKRDKLLRLEETLVSVNGQLQLAVQSLSLNKLNTIEAAVVNSESTGSAFTAALASVDTAVVGVKGDTEALVSDVTVVHSDVKETKTLVSSIAGTASTTRDCVEEISRNIKDLGLRVTRELSPLVDVRSNISVINHRASSIQNTLHEMVILSTDTYNDGIESLRAEIALRREQDQARIERIEQLLAPLDGPVSSRQLDRQLIAKPAATRMLCEDINHLERRSTPSCSPYNESIFTCLCPRIRRRHPRRKWWPVATYDRFEVIEKHVPGCKMAGLAPMRRQTSRYYLTLLHGLLQRAVCLSFVSSSGAGGQSLGMNFTYYPIVDEKKSPVFRILGTLGNAAMHSSYPWNKMSDSNLQALRQSALNRILHAFEERQASPTDISRYDGKSILHALVERNVAISNPNPASADRFVSFTAENFVRMGMPVNHVDENGRTPLMGIMRNAMPVSAHILASKYDAETVTDREYSYPHSFMSMAGRSEALAEAMGCGPLSVAMLHGNEDRVRYLLDRQPSALYEQNNFGHTPILLAAANDKPEMLKLLLSVDESREVINGYDNSGDFPLKRAIGVGSVQCAKVLLQSDCYIPLRILGFCLDGELVNALELCNLVLDGLKERRMRLRDLALRTLPSELARHLDLDSSNVPDGTRANHIIRALVTSHVAIPMALRIEASNRQDEWYTVFHAIDDPEAADLAWKLGFRDVNDTDASGLSPLAHQKYGFRYIDWLVHHGAIVTACPGIPGSTTTPPFLRIINREATAAHSIAWTIGERWDGFVRSVNKQQLARTIFDVEATDRCRCKCSISGCNPALMALKGWFETQHHPEEQYEPRRDDLTLAADSPLILVLWQYMHMSLIRHLTFVFLGIRHTCCEKGYGFIFHRYDSSEEIDEIHEEDKDLLHRLECLVDEFDQKLNRNSDIHDFLQNIWVPRMQVAIQELESIEMSQEEISKAESVGVVWDANQDNTKFDTRGPSRFTIEDWMDKLDDIYPEPGTRIITLD